MNKDIKIFCTIAALMFTMILPQSSFADAQSQRFLADIRQAHKRAFINLIVSYINDAPLAQQMFYAKELANNEVLMAPFSHTKKDFYFSRFKSDPQSALIPSNMLYFYLEDNGEAMATREFFEGRTFHYYKQPHSY